MIRWPLPVMTSSLVLVAAVAAAQPAPVPPAEPIPVASPGEQQTVPLPVAGSVPAALSLDVTGSPAADPAFLETEIRGALDRAIRPTLRPGASLTLGPIVPWPLLPLAEGDRAAVGVTVTIAGDASSAPVTGSTTVTLNSVAVRAVAPSVLYLSDDPEYVMRDGVIFRGAVDAGRAARLYYYHSDIGMPRDLDVVLTAAAPARVRLVASKAGPDLDVLSVGHTVTRDYLRMQQAGESVIADVVPGRAFVVRHALLLQAEVAAGTVDTQALRGTVNVAVIASPAGSRPDDFLNGPRVPFDGHRRHGAFDAASTAPIAAAYVVGGPPAAVQYGARTPTPRNLDPADDGRDYGDYGIVHRITFTLANPTDDAHVVYLYERPLGGPVRSTFLVDGQMKELGCVRVSQPYWVSTYQLPPHTTGASTTVTMTDGGSFYPLEYGVTDVAPAPYTPPVGAPDGCSPASAPFPDVTPAP